MHHALDEFQREGLFRLGGWKYEGRPFVQADRGFGLIGELNGGAPECPGAHAVSGADGIVEARRLRAGAPERSTTTGPCTETILATRGSQSWACTLLAVLRSATKTAPHSPRPPSMHTEPFPPSARRLVNYN